MRESKNSDDDVDEATMPNKKETIMETIYSYTRNTYATLMKNKYKILLVCVNIIQSKKVFTSQKKKKNSATERKKGKLVEKKETIQSPKNGKVNIRK